MAEALEPRDLEARVAHEPIDLAVEVAAAAEPFLQRREPPLPARRGQGARRGLWRRRCWGRGWRRLGRSTGRTWGRAASGGGIEHSVQVVTTKSNDASASGSDSALATSRLTSKRAPATRRATRRA